MRVLVTGAAGLVGRWVVRELIRHDYKVKALDRRSLPEEPCLDGAEMIYADVTDALSMMSSSSNCDAIIHTAAYPSAYNVHHDEIMRVNVAGTQNVLEAAMAHGMKKAIITSSVGALGFSFPKHPCMPDYLPMNIHHPRRPQDIYGVTKLMNEESALAASRLSGLTTISIRPPYVSDLPTDIERPWFMRLIERNTETYHSSLWSYVDVRDLARGFRMALEADLEGYNAFYIMADDTWANATAAELIERHLPDYVKYIPNLTGASLYDLKYTEEKIGFKPHITWRGVQENGLPADI